MSDTPKHSPAPWVYDRERCAIRYQLPAGHPDRYSEDDDGWRNVVSLYSACGGLDGNTDVELMTAAPALLAALLAILPYAQSRIEDLETLEASIAFPDAKVSAAGRALGAENLRKALDAYKAARAAIAAAEGRV